MEVLVIALGILSGLALGLVLGWRKGVATQRARDEKRRSEASKRVAALGQLPSSAALSWTPPERLGTPHDAVLTSAELTRSGLFAAPAEAIGFSSSDEYPALTREFHQAGFVARIEPRTWNWLTATPDLLRFLGWTATDLKENSFLDWIDPLDRPELVSGFQKALEIGEVHRIVCRAQTTSGRRVVQLDIGARYGPDGMVAYLRCRLTDLTDRIRVSRQRRRRARELERVNEELRRANRTLAALKDRYTDLYQNAPAMYFSLDPQGRILACNDTLLKTIGKRRSDLIGQPYEDLLAAECRPCFVERFRRFLSEGKIEAESRWRTVDGRLIDVLVKGTAVFDQSGRLLRSRSVAQDISPLKRLESELRSNNNQLARANAELSARNRELDEFTYVVSHDLQEPVRTLVAFSDFLRQDCADQLDDRGKEYLHHLGEASRRMRRLIQDLLELSKAGKVVSGFTTVSLADVLDEVRQDLSELIRTRGGEVFTKGDLPQVWGDRRRIGQLLTNLVSNGLKYNRTIPPRVEISSRHASRSGSLLLEIADNGIGIAPEYHEKIFHLFRRLHGREEYEGTGAGLAICQKIVEAHGGRIWVESSPNSGSRFMVELPAPPTDQSFLPAPETRQTIEVGVHEDGF